MFLLKENCSNKLTGSSFRDLLKIINTRERKPYRIYSEKKAVRDFSFRLIVLTKVKRFLALSANFNENPWKLELKQRQ